jgi:lipopolysaccharide biosynthesis regulator YciM
MEAHWTTLIWMLPVAAIVSWWLGRMSVRKNDATNLRRIHPEYFKGLNYVLNEQPDKAIEVFIKMLEVDSETVETHLALGNLFRRRGEVDRAIRIHQNLIARPTLSRDERSVAMLELGMDYMSSGLFDRAENLFREVVESGSHITHAYTELLDIYQQEKEWDKAITTARRLENVSGKRFNCIIAHFYCEKAEELRSVGELQEVRDNLHKAISIDPECARASILEAELLVDEGKYKQAIKAYKRIEKQGPDYLSEVIAPITVCYRNLGEMDELIRYLQDMVAQHGDIASMLALSELIAEKEGEEAAVKFISTELKKRPTIRGVDHLIQYALAKTDGGIRDSLISIKELTDRLIRNSPVYKCNKCGFDAKLLHWQCPSCKQWSTLKPVYGVEFG